MILGLTALGEGRMPSRIRLETSVAHLAGGAVGGSLMAGVLWLAGTPIHTLLPPAIPATVVGATAILAVLMDAKLLKLRTWGSQVPPVWFARYGPQRSYAMYGFMLGSGLATARPYAVTYPAFAALALLAPFPEAILGGALFGLGRTVLIGPGSLRATAVSRLLYRAPGVHRVWSVLAVGLSLGVLSIAITFA